MREKSPDQGNQAALRREKRPALVRLILWMIMLCSILGWLRFAQAINQREIIQEFTSSAIFLYLLAAGFTWGALGVVFLWAWLTGAGWALDFFRIIAIFYPLAYWVERLCLWQDSTGQQNWAFMLILTILWFGLVIGLWKSRRVNACFAIKNKKRTDL